ncbi:MAG: DUF4430 domain-containing protein [Patescibacteria group bacterium]
MTVRARVKELTSLIGRFSRGSISLADAQVFFMQNFSKGVGILVLVFAISTIIYVLLVNPFSRDEVKLTVENSGITDELNLQQPQIESSFSVYLNEHEDLTLTSFYSSGINVLEMMELVREHDPNAFSFSGADSDYGFFVEEINGVSNNTANSDYWSLYVNNDLSQVGASDYIVQDNDRIEWRYEHVEF